MSKVGIKVDETAATTVLLVFKSLFSDSGLCLWNFNIAYSSLLSAGEGDDRVTWQAKLDWYMLCFHPGASCHCDHMDGSAGSLQTIYLTASTHWARQHQTGTLTRETWDSKIFYVVTTFLKTWFCGHAEVLQCIFCGKLHHIVWFVNSPPEMIN